MEINKLLIVVCEGIHLLITSVHTLSACPVEPATFLNIVIEVQFDSLQ